MDKHGRFEHGCMCGGYAAPLNGRDVMRPHVEWCPQRKEYNAWADRLGRGAVLEIRTGLKQEPH